MKFVDGDDDNDDDNLSSVERIFENSLTKSLT